MKNFYLLRKWDIAFFARRAKALSQKRFFSPKKCIRKSQRLRICKNYLDPSTKKVENWRPKSKKWWKFSIIWLFMMSIHFFGENKSFFGQGLKENCQPVWSAKFRALGRVTTKSLRVGKFLWLLFWNFCRARLPEPSDNFPESGLTSQLKLPENSSNLALQQFPLYKRDIENCRPVDFLWYLAPVLEILVTS